MIHDLAGLTLEVTNLEQAVLFYQSLFGFGLCHHDIGQGVAEFALPSGQTLSLWKPITRQPNNPRLGKLGARGGTHVHFALQIPKGQREQAQACLRAWGITYQEINLAEAGAEPDLGLYFFDPFGHGLELRQVVTDPTDPRFPAVPPGKPPAHPHLPVVGLREVALTFQDFAAMKQRLGEVYRFVFVEQMKERAFAQFVLGPEPEKDGRFTPGAGSTAGTPRWGWPTCWAASTPRFVFTPTSSRSRPGSKRRIYLICVMSKVWRCGIQKDTCSSSASVLHKSPRTLGAP